MNRYAKKTGIATATLTLLVLLAGCGKASSTSLSGTYKASTGQDFITFHPDGTALLNIGTHRVTTTYTIANSTVSIRPPKEVGEGRNLQLKIDDNGCLYGDSGGMDPHQKICKTD